MSDIPSPETEAARKAKRKAYEKAYRDANKEKRNAHHRAWYAANKTHCKEWHAAYHQANRTYQINKIVQWQKANPDKVKAAQKRRYETTPIGARRREASKRYRAENREKCAIRDAAYAKTAKFKEIQVTVTRNRRARIKLSLGRHTAADIRDLLSLQRYRCALCSISIRGKHQVDHIMPIARGGANDRRNLQLLCRTCNQRKNAMHPLDFARKIGLLL